MPADICLITRDIDHAYLDLFFRDTWMLETVQAHLLGAGVRSEGFVRIDERKRPGK